MSIKKVSDTLMVVDNSSFFYTVMAIGLLFIIAGFGMLWKPISVQPQPSGFGFLFFIGGAGIIFIWGALNSIVIDKSSGKLAYSYWSVLSRSSLEVELARIESVTFTKVWQSMLGRWDAQTVFKQTDGKEIVVLRAISSSDDAKKIAEFIGVSFSCVSPPSSNGRLDPSLLGKFPPPPR